MAAWSRMMMELRMTPDVPARLRDWFDGEQAACSAIRTPSPFIPLDMALDLHARVPRSELRIFPGARHALACTHAKECATALREFLARRVPARV